eukprot:1619820-Rhodomonas_salina.1
MSLDALRHDLGPPTWISGVLRCIVTFGPYVSAWSSPNAASVVRASQSAGLRRGPIPDRLQGRPQYGALPPSCPGATTRDVSTGYRLPVVKRG